MRAIREKSPSTARQIRTAFINFYGFIEEFDVAFYRSEFHTRLANVYFKAEFRHKAVMTLDAENGPLSRLDEYTLVASLNLMPQTSRDASIISLLHAWGLRPRQVSLLDMDDLVVTAFGESRSFALRVKRVKQHEGRVGSEYKLRKLTPEVGERLYALNASCGGRDGGTADRRKPMFREAHGPGAGVARLSAKAISAAVSRYAANRKLISPVTGSIVKIDPRRLRETFGTRCAEMQGMTKDLLAEMLDHSSTRSLDVYFDFRESIAHEIGALVSGRKGYGTLRDITERFVALGASDGMPLRTEFPIRFLPHLCDATNAAASALRFTPPDLVGLNLYDIPSLGACGGSFRCGLAPVATCYGCSDFEPWIEADHDRVAEWLGELARSADARGARDDFEEFGLLKVKAEYVAQRAKALRMAKRSRA